MRVRLSRLRLQRVLIKTAYALLTALVERKLLPAGAAYLAHVKRAVHKLTFEEHDKHVAEEQKRLATLNGNGVDGEDDLGVGDEEETEDLLTLDPKEWKVRGIAYISEVLTTEVLLCS